MSEAHTIAPAESRSGRALRRRFDDLERRVRTVLGLQGVSRTVCLVFGGVIVYGLLDWLIHFDDPGLRWLIALSLAAATGWTVWRWLWSPLAEQRSHASLAGLLEHQRPFVGSQLVSAAEFLDHGLDARLGSPILQRAVVDQAEHRLASIDFDAAVDRRGLRHQALAAFGICGLALVLVVLFPRDSATAVTRLVFPWRNTPWPRHVQLELIDHHLTTWTNPEEPRRMSRGDTLELYAVNRRGELPQEVLLEYRIGEDRLIREPMRKTILRDDQGHPVDVVSINLPATRGPIHLRAIGGDDDLMPFFEVQVVSPPEIGELKVHLDPPAYAQQPAETLPTGSGDVQALWGTRVTWSATASQPLTEASLVFQGGGKLPLKIAEDGRSFAGEFALTDPKITGYRFELTNLDGFRSSDRSASYQLRIIPDQAPQVTLEEPSGNVTATADAVLPLRIAVKDDLGLVSVSLLHQREGVADFQERPLKSFENLPTDERLTETWPLEPMELSPGDRLQFYIAATDAFDLGSPHVGQSTTRIVTIVGGEEKRNELTDQLAELLADLSEEVAVERRISEQTGELHTQWEASDKVRAEDADLLRKLDLQQQRVLHRLLEPGDSVRTQAERLLDEFEANHLSGDETTTRLKSLADVLTDLGKEALPELQRRMTLAQKQAADSVDHASKELSDDLEELQRRQEEAVAKLESLESELSDWRDRRHIAQQLSGLIEAQRSLNRETQKSAADLLKHGMDDWSPEQRAEIAKLAQRQRSEADAVDEFRKQLAETADTLANKDPDAARNMEEMAADLERTGTSGQMRDAAGSLREGRLGQASQQQEAGLKALEELENLLADRPPDDQELLVKRMKGLESDLETLHKAEQELADELRSAAAQPPGDERTESLEKLMRRQDELQKQLADVERQLERLKLRRPQQAVQRAGEQMEQLADSIDQPDELQDRLEETLDDLEQARRDLAEERQRVEEELAYEQLLRLKDELQALAERQSAARAEVIRLEEQRKERGSLTRGQLRTLAQTADVERQLSQTVAGLSERVSAAEVVAMALRGLSEHLGVVADLLEQKETHGKVQQELDRIEGRLARLLKILSPDEPPQPDQTAQQQPGQEGEPPPAGPPGDVITLIAQLELLKDLQADLAERTAELQAERDADGTLPKEAASELEAVQRDQTRLTDLARNMLQKLLQQNSGGPEAPTEEKPEHQNENEAGAN